MSLHFYPVNPYEVKCEDYIVKINGQEVILDTARVSAVPFNRRWPGHQRQIEQTELVNFLSMAADEVLKVEILPVQPFEKAVVRPLGSVADVSAADGKICFTIEKPGFYTVEPYGRNHHHRNVRSCNAYNPFSSLCSLFRKEQNAEIY